MKMTIASIMIAAISMTAFGAERQLRFSTDKPIVVGNKTLPAGAYLIERGGVSRQSVYIENRLNRQGAFLALPISADTAFGSATPSIKLACAPASCQVVEVSGLTEGKAFRAVHSPKGEIVAISMRGSSAE
jgi:hypothetical protein